jgi:hypothetical protein
VRQWKSVGLGLSLSIIDKWWLTSWITHHLLSLYNPLQLTTLEFNCFSYYSTTAKGLNKWFRMEQKNEEHTLPIHPSPVMSKTRVSQTWVESSTIIGISPDRMELKKKTCWVEWPPKPVCDLWPGRCWPTKILDFLWRELQFQFYIDERMVGLQFQFQFQIHMQKWNLESDLGSIQFRKSDPVPVQFWVTQGPELVFHIWLPFS